MLRKCLKYDVKSVFRIWWIVAASVLGLSIFGSIVLRLTIEMVLNTATATRPVLHGLLLVAGFVLSFLCIAAVVSSGIVTSFLVYYRYYKNFFTDEGYLTFTLPVSRKTLLLSKVLNAMIFQLAHAFLLIGCIAIYLFVAPPAAEGYLFNPGAFYAIGTALRLLWEAIGAWLLLYIFEGILILIALTLFAVGLIHFCITIGAVLAKKHKLLAAIGVYYLVNFVMSFGGQILYYILFAISGAGLAEVLGRLTEVWQGCLAVGLAGALATVILLAFSCIIHFISLSSLERKLNLA